MEVKNVKRAVERRKVITVFESDKAEEITLTLKADELIALVVLWAHSMDGWDGPGGIRNRIDEGMDAAWKEAFPNTPRDTLRLTGDATTRATKACRAVFGESYNA